MGLKEGGIYSIVGDTTLRARTVFGQSLFMKKDEEKLWRGQKKGYRFVRSLSVTRSFI